VVISSTGAPHVIITRDLIERIMPKRTAEKLVIVDIAVPRDVEPEVGDMPGVELYNIDDLKGRIEANREQRCREVQGVLKIINNEVEKFHAWYQTLEVQPVIKDLKNRSEEIRMQEIKHALRRMNTELSESDMQIVEDLSRRIVNKILHQPFIRLREEAIVGNGHNYTAAVRSLFGLEEKAEKSGSPL
jgi:glutamyl-tRNA reductase